MTGWKRIFAPLASRKIRVALATVVAAYAAEYGLGVSEEIIMTVLGVGVAVILGIAHEDAGAKAAAKYELTELKAEPMLGVGYGQPVGKNGSN